MTAPVDSTICPLCQTKNQCGVNGITPCWCTKEKVPEALMSQISDESLNKSCICQACIQKFNVDNVKEVK